MSNLLMRLGRAVASRLAPAIAVAAALLLLAASSPARSATQPYTGVSIRLHGNSVTPSNSAHDRFPKLKLVTVMVPWDALQPSQTSFDWSQLNANVRDAQADGYKLIVRLMAGDHAPSWLFDKGASSLRLIQGDVGSRNFCAWTTIPVPWDAKLREHYTNLIRGIGNWMTRSPGGRGVNGQYVHLVSVSMPMWDTAEMTMGYGSDEVCPSGTPAAGSRPRDHNRAAWDALAGEDERRRLLEAAWSQAIDIHMDRLPASAQSVIAYGQIFWDDQAAARRLADRKTGQYGSRLWSMYTNLQPSVRRDGSLGPWRERCPSCHDTLMAAKARGGYVGFLTAGREFMNTTEKFRSACEDGLSTYGMKFLETSEDKLAAHEGYLIRDRGNLQSRL